jgi:hypothetical protein
MAFVVNSNPGAEPEARFSLLGILKIRFSKIAFGKAYIIDSIQQVCFSTAVFTTKTGYIFRKSKGVVPVVPELCQRYVLQLIQSANLY